jgi:hypothetical protein
MNTDILHVHVHVCLHVMNGLPITEIRTKLTVNYLTLKYQLHVHVGNDGHGTRCFCY